MSEIIQIPNNINLQLGTLLFGQNPDYQSGKFTLEDLKNFLDDYFSNNNSGGSGNATIHVGQIPPESAIDGTKWIETDETGIFINEWNYCWLGSQYRWCGDLQVSPLVVNSTTNSVVFDVNFDYFIKNFTSYIRITDATTFQSGAYIRFSLIKSSLTNIGTNRFIDSIDFTSFSAGRNYSDSIQINEVLVPKYQNIDSDTSDIIGLRMTASSFGFGGTYTSMSSVSFAKIRKDFE